MNTGPLTTSVDPIRLSLAIRAYAEPVAGRKPLRPSRVEHPSDWVLVFDTETTTLAGQALRFGTYQVRKAGELFESGLFYRPEVMSTAEVELLTTYAEQHRLKLRTQAEFVDEVFYGIGYDLRATIVGFNLPFDVSRLAIRYGTARRSMRGGFTFTLSKDKRRPAIRVKHLSRRVSFFKFAAPFRQRTGLSNRRRGQKMPARGGFFLDVNTLAHALLSRSFTLASLADHLETKTRKAETDEHGGALSIKYIGYALQDTQVTWECCTELTARYQTLQLKMPVTRIYTEASLGKATLDAMGVRPWRDVQPNMPAELLGIILSTYYGGRSEIRIRREVRQVILTDFLSMYPSVCTLMGLWRFVIATGVTWQDDTEAVRAFLDNAGVAELEDQRTWRHLTVLVQIEPSADIVPVRTDYDETGSTTIGLNYLSAEQPLWLTLADCLVSKLLSGRAPKVVRAIRFTPMATQKGLYSINVNGDPENRINPRNGDFYKRLIELRQGVKVQLKDATAIDAVRLDTLQHALKITANATSYGIFAEVNVDEPAEPGKMRVHTGAEEFFDVTASKSEEPGRFFHPLVAALITGGARLMLALAEKHVIDAGLEWAFCDTDSMAIARPLSLDEADFHRQVDEIVAWFAALNPYKFTGSVLKVEDVNASLTDRHRREPLYCYAVSAKRYALFNVNKQDLPGVRKASAHGLGHLREPYNESNPAPSIPKPDTSLEKIGVALWQHDLWWTIAKAALRGPVVQLPLDYHPAMLAPAVSRYAASTPEIHRWFRRYNDQENRSYDEEVKPFGFLLAFSARHGDTRRPVSPFERDYEKAVSAAFDRLGGEPIEADALLSYAKALAPYHLSPEAKFLNGDYCDSGTTLRRQVVARGRTFIGKEANRWEEQFFLGLNAEAVVEYGVTQTHRACLVAELIKASNSVSERKLADQLGIARETLRRLLANRTAYGSSKLWREIEVRLNDFDAVQRRDQEALDRAMSVLRVEINRDGLKTIARRLGFDSANLDKISKRRRRMPEVAMRRLLASEAYQNESKC